MLSGAVRRPTKLKMDESISKEGQRYAQVQADFAVWGNTVVTMTGL